MDFQIKRINGEYAVVSADTFEKAVHSAPWPTSQIASVEPIRPKDTISTNLDGQVRFEIGKQILVLRLAGEHGCVVYTCDEHEGKFGEETHDITPSMLKDMLEDLLDKEGMNEQIY